MVIDFRPKPEQKAYLRRIYNSLHRNPKTQEKQWRLPTSKYKSAANAAPDVLLRRHTGLRCGGEWRIPSAFIPLCNNLEQKTACGHRIAVSKPQRTRGSPIPSSILLRGASVT
jgi:hypothetical protein